MTILSAAAVAAYLGVFCAISPCPLATNIAAVGFVSRGLSPVRTLLGGLLYATGRAAVYVLIAVALVSGIAAVPELSHVLQKHMNRAMGPILVIVATVLLGLIPLPSFGTGRFSAVQKRLANSGFAGAFLLGACFALAFCPTSAALYFGSPRFFIVAPLDLRHRICSPRGGDRSADRSRHAESWRAIRMHYRT